MELLEIDRFVGNLLKKVFEASNINHGTSLISFDETKWVVEQASFM